MINKEDQTKNEAKKLMQDKLDFLNKREEELIKNLKEGEEKEKKIYEEIEDLKEKITQISSKMLSETDYKKLMQRMEKILSNQEKKEIQKEFGNKSITEIQEKIKKEPGKRERMKKKIWIPIVGINVALAVSLGIYEFIQYQKKYKQDQEQVINPKDNSDSTTAIIQPTRIEANIDSLKAHINQEQMEKFVSYETLTDNINNIQKDEIREKLLKYLYQGKIIEAQEMFGMKINSKYPSNTATGKIDRNTLERFSNPHFGLYGKEILEHQDIPQDVKDIYQKFLLGEIKNNGENYLIISKINFNVYLFSKEHALIYRQVSLLGKDRGKEGERVPYPWYKTNQGYEYHKKTVNTNTPEGLFLVQKEIGLRGKYITDGPKSTGLVLMPIDTKTQKINYDKYKTDKFGLEIHPIYQPPEDKNQYKDAITSKKITDNKVSHGCINVAKDGILKDNLTTGKSVVFITDDKQPPK